MESSNEEYILLKQSSHLAVIHSFANCLSSLGDIDELFWHVAEVVMPQLGFEDCTIFQYDFESQKLIQKSIWNLNPNREEQLSIRTHVALGEGIVGAAAQTGEIVNIPDTRLDDRYKIGSIAYLSECSIPLKYDNKVIGVLDSEHSEVNFFTNDKQQLLVTVAALLATRVGNSISLQKIEHTVDMLRNAEKLQKALYDIASLLHKAQNMEDFYVRLHKIIGNLMYAGNFYVALYDKKQGVINLPYFIDTVDDAPDQNISVEFLKQSLTLYCINANKTFFLTREDINEMDREHGFQRYGTTPNAWLGVPFILDKTTSGIIVVQSYVDNIKYTENDVELLEFVAQHLSTTLKYKRAQEQIQYQALHDALTGLANRSLFTDRLQHRMASRKRNCEGMFAIFFLDLDHFKEINDSLGHPIGDLVLQEVSQRLKNSVRANDTIARFGGDEFAVLLDMIEAQSEALDAANRIIKAIEKEFIFAGKPYFISVSIGIRCCTDESNIEDIIKHADLAMYQAKQSGRARYSIYLKDQIIIEATRKKLKQELQQAIINEEFEIYYQPIVLLNNLSIVGFEALVRWQHPIRGLLIPDEFLDVAEQTGSIIEMDMLVMEKAISQMKQWAIDESHLKICSVNVNLSASHFSSTKIISKIKHLLTKYQLPGKQLKIEITETALIQSLEIMTGLIKQIRELGVSIVLDDFGTGYSSLSYLHQFPIDILKIDRSFISNMGENSDAYPIITTIIALASAMFMDVVAEGIEEPYQLDKLRDMGCKYGQGLLFSKPLGVDKLKELFKKGIQLESGI